ncbi:MAG: hypothetical protein FJY82_01070 [Candidatus Aminicenantes bacterium]|nr:hypothetical protein [Candidatus Aminicenantes bacterium]
MSCDRRRRRISDDLDGVLSPGRSKKLAAHLALCLDCRAYRRGLEALQAAVRSAPGPARSPEDGARAIGRLAAGIREESGRAKVRALPVSRRIRPWAWAGAASLLAAGTFLFLHLRPAGVTEAVLPDAFEDPWISLAGRLDDADVARTFAASLQSALNESLREIQGEVVPFLDRQALFLEDLSDEEVRLVNQELAREIPD